MSEDFDAGEAGHGEEGHGTRPIVDSELMDPKTPIQRAAESVLKPDMGL
jgi:hypothetical protein